jgi:hypothetical protein
MFTPTLEWDKSTLSQQEQQSQPLVVINEIGWSGTLASTADEWIELRNNSSTALDLTGWTLTWGREEDPWVIRFTDTEESNSKEVRSSVLASRGFYLLERSDDEVIRDIRADLIYSGSLRNTGEIIVLRNSDGDIIDTANSEGGEWPAGSTSQNEISYASMERINPTLHDSSDNWLSNNGVLKNGRDADGNLVNGTPKAENSQKNTE